MKARFVGGSLDGQVREGVAGAHFCNPVPRRQVTTADEMRRWPTVEQAMQPRPARAHGVEFYKMSVERDAVGRPISLVYTYERTEERP